MAAVANLDDDLDFPNLDADGDFPNLADDDEFGGDDYPGARRLSGSKRPIGDVGEEVDDVFSSKKAKAKAEESGPGADTGMILSLRENLQNCKDNLVTCKSELEAARLEIQKWHSAFMNGPVTPAGTSPEPGVVVTYHQNLKSSEESLREQVEKAKKREAALIVTFAKREQEIADLKSAVLDLKTQLRPSAVQILALTMKITALKSQNADLRNQFGALYKEMEGLGSDVERSNEMVYILQRRVEAKDLELRRLKEHLSQIEEKEEEENKQKRLVETSPHLEVEEEPERPAELLSQIEVKEEGNELREDDTNVADNANATEAPAEANAADTSEAISADVDV